MTLDEMETLIRLKADWKEVFFRKIGDDMFICRAPTFAEIDAIISVAMAFDADSFEYEFITGKMTCIFGDKQSPHYEQAMSEIGEEIFKSLPKSNEDMNQYKKNKLDKIKFGPYTAMLQMKEENGLTVQEIDQMTMREFVTFIQEQTQPQQQQSGGISAPPGFDIPNVKINI